jgi:uncharacterized protein (DUF1499 family)
MLKLAGKRPQTLGVQDGRFRAPATGKPNWVSSQAEAGDRVHAIAPLAFSGDAVAAMQRLHGIVDDVPRARIIESRPDYLYVEFSSALMGYVDDVEFYCDGRMIQLRSSSRLGYSDLGANRKRVEALRAAFSV